MIEKHSNILIAGAGRHVKDLICLLEEYQGYDEFVFFEDIETENQPLLYNNYKVLRTLEAAKGYFQEYTKFVIGIGGSAARKTISDKLISVGGEVLTVISTSSTIGSHDVQLGRGLNIMPYVFISNSVKIGEGTLVNTRASIHHDVQVGKYCDIAPGATLLGGAKVGDFAQIGANTTVLPNVTIGRHCTVGAGAVVTKNIPDGKLVKGIPAK